jgi:hypothetical protein
MTAPIISRSSSGTPNMDAFADDVIKRMDPRVRETLTPAQLEAVIDALGGARRPSGAIELRGALPLYFARFFFLLYVARDRRTATARLDGARRSKASHMGVIMFTILVLSPFILLFLGLLYLLKVAFGVDVFPEYHLYDMFR